ncbi:nucleotidyltransferase family protein [Cohnella sp. AR92]|uniref:nucleotidyltransferase domain-containing protein n=1 Tax=Cohnella sp. AR92 TaxID=648716 RepID=UPI000F8EE618|nr:nucleotidyltransferase family protein [Cohnella sp. AR92]RUS42652.1 Renal dipeptidase [Cohnella sp. AR92]
MEKPIRLNIEALPKELTVMLQALRRPNMAGERPHRGPELPHIDWNQFLKLVRHHRVYPQLQGHPDGELIPADVLQTIGRDYQRNAFRMLRLSGETERVCRALAERGIRSLLLKGPALACLLYGDVSLRTSKDADILIPVSDLETAERLMNELGYRAERPIPRGLGDWKWKTHHIAFLHSEHGIEVELHWRLNGEGGKEPSFEELWGARQPCALGASLFMPGEEHLFYYLATHGARHGWFRLRWLADIDRMARRGDLDWEKLLALLRSYESLDAAAQALVLSASLLDTPIPPAMEGALSESRGRELATLALGFIRDGTVLSTDPNAGQAARDYKRYLFELRTGSQKRRYLLSRLYPSYRDAEALPLPKPLYFLYFPLRPFVWLWRQVRQQT